MRGSGKIWAWRVLAAALVASAAAGAAESAPARLPAGGQADPSGPRVSNVWVEMDLREVLQDVATQTGVPVIADQTVQGVVSLAVKDMPLEECLERVCAAGGYSFARVRDYYIVGRADASSPLFERLADMRRVQLRHATADQVKGMLPANLAPYVTYDKTNGVVLVTAPPGPARRVLDAIALVDMPSQQVAVEAVVFELSEEGSKRLGLDWQYQNADMAGQVENLVGTITFDASADIATYVNVSLRAILQDGKGRVLANPRLVTMDGRDAEIFVGQEKYFTILSGPGANPYFRLESIKAGVTLKITPHIGEGGQIALDFEPEVSDVVSDWMRDDVEIPELRGTTLPVVTRRRAKTSVAIRDGQTIVIGGLLREQHRQMIDKVPLLGDIPLLGLAFRKVRDWREQQEVVILITTHVVSDARQSGAPDVATPLEEGYLSPLDPISGPTGGRR